MRLPVRLLALCLAAAAPLAGAAHAQDEAAYDVYAHREVEPRIATERTQEGLYTTRAPLSALRAEQGDIRLHGASASAELGLELAPQAVVERARLVVRHVNARAQRDTQSHLRIGLNNRFAAQLDAVTERAAGVNEITLLPGDLRYGFNALQFDAVQRYTFECQDPMAEELWTDIDAARSYVELTYRRRPFTAGLADLDQFVSAGVGGVETLGVVTGGAPREQSLRWGAIAAQAVANRMGYRMPAIRALDAAALASPEDGEAEFADADLVAVGTFEELGLTPPADIAPDEAYLAVRPSPFDPGRFMIVVSGVEDAAVDRAVLTFAAIDFPLADAAEARLAPRDAPAGFVAPERAPLRPGAKYAFGDLGFKDVTAIGLERSRSVLNFELPADLHLQDDETFDLNLDFAYGAGLKSDSVLNILANGQFLRAIRLTNPDGEVIPNYRMQLDADALKAGANTLAFEVELSSEQSGHCAARNMRHLAFALGSRSTLALPAAQGLAALPDLKLMAETGYPYSGAETSDFAFVAADRTPETRAAVWTLAAKFGQLHGAVFADAGFAYDRAPGEGHVFLVGSRKAIGQALPGDLRLSDRMRAAALAVGPAVERSSGFSAIDLGDNGLLYARERPGVARAQMSVLTAETPVRLLDAARSLVKPTHWSQLSGGAAVWRDGPATVAVQKPARVFLAGDADPVARVRVASSLQPWRWIAAIAVALFAMASILALLSRYMRGRITKP